MYQTKRFTRNLGKRCAILMLILSVLFTLSPTAYAKENLTKKIVDVVVVGDDPRSQIALLTDGTVRTTGLAHAGYSKSLIRWVSSWTDIVQICTMGLHVFGLKEDGRVVSTIGREPKDTPLGYLRPERRFDPNTWTGVKELISSGDFEYYGLTRDGRILVSNDEQGSCFGGCASFMNWTDIKKAVFFAYGEDRGLFGLRGDGTAIAAEDSAFTFYGGFSEPVRDVVDIDSSGYIFCALLKDGTVRLGGVVGEMRREDAARLHDVAQIAVCYQTLLCRLKDGTVVSCGSEGIETLPKDWGSIVEIQSLHPQFPIGLCLGEDGKLHATGDFGEDLQKELESWEDIVRVTTQRGVLCVPEPYVLAWESDGTLHAWGIDVSALLAACR